MGKQLLAPAMSFGYGYARGTIGQWVAPYAAKIPGGAYADNIAIGGGLFLLRKMNVLPSNALLNQAVDVAINSEAFLAGVKASAGVSLTGAGSVSLTNGTPQYL